MTTLEIPGLTPSEEPPTIRDAAAFVWSALNVAEDAGAPIAVLGDLLDALRALEDLCEPERPLP